LIELECEFILFSKSLDLFLLFLTMSLFNLTLSFINCMLYFICKIFMNEILVLGDY